MFFYSLPILINELQLLSPAEFMVILCGLFLMLYISTPQLNEDWKNQSFDSVLLAAWVGGVSLQKVFWPYFMCLNAGLIMTDWLARDSTITVSSWDEIHSVLFLTSFWWAVSLWRCSANSNAKLWAALARLATVAVFVEFGLKLYIRIDYPRIYFKCEGILLNYGSCF